MHYNGRYVNCGLSPLRAIPTARTTTNCTVYRRNGVLSSVCFSQLRKGLRCGVHATISPQISLEGLITFPPFQGPYRIQCLHSPYIASKC
jgi:hypothetical protein